MTSGVYVKHLNDWVQLVYMTWRELIKQSVVKYEGRDNSLSVLKYGQNNANFSEIHYHTEASQRRLCFL